MITVNLTHFTVDKMLIKVDSFWVTLLKCMLKLTLDLLLMPYLLMTDQKQKPTPPEEMYFKTVKSPRKYCPKIKISWLKTLATTPVFHPNPPINPKLSELDFYINCCKNRKICYYLIFYSFLKLKLLKEKNLLIETRKY